MTAAVEVRVCARPSCGKELVRHVGEKTGNWKARRRCGRACAIAARSEHCREVVDDVFNAQIQRGGPAECWLWTGRLDKGGYGLISVPGRRSSERAHRYAYRRDVGSIPSGCQIDHTCHNYSGCAGGLCDHRRCVNPAHLEAVTQGVNLRRSHLHHANATHCPQGHPYDNENTRHVGGKRYCRACRRVPTPRPLKPCGTEAAYLRHRRHGEPTCDPCKAAVAARARADRARRMAVAS